jgi:uncharacterized membrane protein
MGGDLVTASRIELSRPTGRAPSASVRRPVFPAGTGALLIPLALLVPLAAARGSWSAQFLLVLFLFTVPGVILLRALRIPGVTIAAFPVYVPCGSLVVLLGSGVAVNAIGPAIGVAAPLRTWPVLAGLELTCLILLAASAGAPPGVVLPWRDALRPGRTALWPALALVLPLIAAAGALRLNANRGNGVALVALVACVLVIVALFAYAPRLSSPLLAAGLYAAALAMLWSFSLRGASVYGFDISDEYYILQQTVASGVWHAAHPDNVYAAMLSTTVLPAELHAVTGVPDLLVLKVVYPAISALFPVAAFFLARRVLSARWAFAAGALIITQSSFGQEMPAIARQEIALVLFVALVAAALERDLRRTRQWPLAALFALGMVVSHYTTSYITITLLAVTVLFQWASSRFRPVPGISVGVAVAFAAATACAVAWYGPVTHSASNVAQLVQVTRAQGLALLPDRGQAGGLIAAYLDGNTVTPISPGQYAQDVQHEYATTKPFVHALPDAADPAYRLRAPATPAPPARWAAAGNAAGTAQVVAQQLIYVLGAAGALILVFRRRIPIVARQVGFLSVATLAFLVAIRFSGTLAAFYNAQRAVLQAMVFLDIALFWCLQELAGRRSAAVRACAIGATAASMALIFAVGNGLAGVVFDTGTATNLANSGDDFEQFYVTAPELASASWLGAQVQRGQLVYTDEYGQLPLVSVTGISSGLMLDVTPRTLDAHAWVYATPANVVDGQARASYNGHSVTYAFPVRFLQANYDLVYTNGSSEVYHR